MEDATSMRIYTAWDHYPIYISHSVQNKTLNKYEYYSWYDRVLLFDSFTDEIIASINVYLN